MNDDATYLFRYGADMDPSRALAGHPAARFVARAWVPSPVTALPPLPTIEPPPPLPGAASAPPDAVWGILLRLSEAMEGDGGRAAAPVEATTDDGRRFAAVVVTPPSALDDPGAVLAAARYWELPPAYVRRLAAWAEAPA